MSWTLHSLDPTERNGLRLVGFKTACRTASTRNTKQPASQQASNSENTQQGLQDDAPASCQVLCPPPPQWYGTFEIFWGGEGQWHGSWNPLVVVFISSYTVICLSFLPFSFWAKNANLDVTNYFGNPLLGGLCTITHCSGHMTPSHWFPFKAVLRAISTIVLTTAFS